MLMLMALSKLSTILLMLWASELEQPISPSTMLMLSLLQLQPLLLLLKHQLLLQLLSNKSCNLITHMQAAILMLNQL